MRMKFTVVTIERRSTVVLLYSHSRKVRLETKEKKEKNVKWELLITIERESFQ